MDVARQNFLALVILAVLGLFPGVVFAEHHVLLVFDEDKDLPGLAAINRSLRDGLRAEFGADVAFYSESLQLSQFGGEEHDRVLDDYFRRKYAGKRVDLIVAVMGPTLDFLLRHREGLFSGVPIVFCGADSSEIEGKTLPAGVTGVMMKRAFAPTLDMALHLQPRTRHVYVIGGTSRFDLRILSIARRDLQPFEERASIEWLTTLSMDDLLAKVARLPPDSVIYYLTLFADGAGHPFVTHDALKRITSAANAPVYVSVDQYVGSGAVGGNVYSVSSLGEHGARVVTRILRGEAPSAIEPESLASYVPIFDWRALQRWHVDEERLPANSRLEFRVPSAWESYRWFIVGGITLILLQSALVVGLLVSRAERRRAELAREESEARRRRAEEDAQRQRDELAHALRLTTLGELTASISHELNQPLTAIAVNAQAAQRLFSNDRANPDLEEALEDLVTDSIRAAEIIRRLQALFRKKPAVRSEIDVNALVEDVMHLLGSDMRNRQIGVHFQRFEPLRRVLGDSIQLRQVIINLLRNAEDAISAAADGSRQIFIETSHPEEDWIAVAIRDNGTGVKEADLERIFEHFVSSKPQGLGMGLAISRSIVEAHGGKIWATRGDERGLTLHIRLPAVAAQQSEASANDESAGSPRKAAH
jgi:signal transduction histidine kinase